MGLAEPIGARGTILSRFPVGFDGFGTLVSREGPETWFGCPLTQDASHHQDYIFSSGSQTKFSWEGEHPRASRFEMNMKAHLGCMKGHD